MDFLKVRQGKFSMYKYINKMLDKLPSNMEGSAKTSVASLLFDTNTECKKLFKERVIIFHHIVAKLVYASSSGFSTSMVNVPRHCQLNVNK